MGYEHTQAAGTAQGMGPELAGNQAPWSTPARYRST
jgi:hypothetical protein